jgi:hypothetical protein
VFWWYHDDEDDSKQIDQDSNRVHNLEENEVPACVLVILRKEKASTF